MILVVGATGILGGMVTRRLLDRSRAVRMLVRRNSEYGGLERAGAEVRFGDLKDPVSVDAAMHGVDIVVATANSAMRGGEDSVQSVEIEGYRNLIDAARRAEVRQFVFVSALGSSLDSPVPFLRAKAMTEEYLRGSGVPHTILAPNVFMEGWIGLIVGMPLQSGRPITLVGEGRRRHSFVSIQDVAAFTLATVGNAATLGRYIPVAGPVAVSWRDVVKSCSESLGRDLPVNWIPTGESVPGMPAAISQLMAAFETYDSEVDMSETVERYGISLTPVDVFVRRAFAPTP